MQEPYTTNETEKKKAKLEKDQKKIIKYSVKHFLTVQFQTCIYLADFFLRQEKGNTLYNLKRKTNCIF